MAMVIRDVENNQKQGTHRGRNISGTIRRKRMKNRTEDKTRRRSRRVSKYLF